MRASCTSIGLNFPLLADPDRQLIQAMGVWVEKSLYGRRYFGIARATFVISAEGRIEKVWEKVSPDGHGPEVLAYLRGEAAPAKPAPAPLAQDRADREGRVEAGRPGEEARREEARGKEAQTRQAGAEAQAAGDEGRAAQGRREEGPGPQDGKEGHPREDRHEAPLAARGSRWLLGHVPSIAPSGTSGAYRAQSALLQSRLCRSALCAR